MFALQKYVYPVTNLNLEAITDHNGELWFKASSVCHHLEIGLNGNVSRLIKDVLPPRCYRERSDGTPGRPSLWITLGGFNRLIMQGKTDASVAFQDWVCDVVLPDLLKTGTYTLKPEDTKHFSAVGLSTLIDKQVDKVFSEIE